MSLQLGILITIAGTENVPHANSHSISAFTYLSVKHTDGWCPPTIVTYWEKNHANASVLSVSSSAWQNSRVLQT